MVKRASPALQREFVFERLRLTAFHDGAIRLGGLPRIGKVEQLGRGLSYNLLYRSFEIFRECRIYDDVPALKVSDVDCVTSPFKNGFQQSVLFFQLDVRLSPLPLAKNDARAGTSK